MSKNKLNFFPKSHKKQIKILSTVIQVHKVDELRQTVDLSLQKYAQGSGSKTVYIVSRKFFNIRNLGQKPKLWLTIEIFVKHKNYDKKSKSQVKN